MWARARAFASSKVERRVIDLAAVLDVDLQGPLQRQQARLAIDQRQQLHAEGRLQRRVLEELVEDLLAAAPRA